MLLLNQVGQLSVTGATADSSRAVGSKAVVINGATADLSKAVVSD